MSGEILPQRKPPRTITLRDIIGEVGLNKHITDITSFEETYHVQILFILYLLFAELAVHTFLQNYALNWKKLLYSY